MATTNRLRDLAPHPTRRDSPATGSFALLVVAALVVGGAGFGGYMLLASKASAPDISDAVLSATARRDPATATATPVEVDDGRWGDAELQHCDKEAAEMAQEASQRRLAAVSANRVGLGAPEASFVQRAAYLLCSARTKPTHLCQAYWHDQLVERIKAYSKEFAEVRQTAYWNKVSLAAQARSNVGPTQAAIQAATENIDETTRDVMKLNQDITDAVRALVADGILKKDEFGFLFGFGIAPDVRTLLGDAEPVRNACG